MKECEKFEQGSNKRKICEGDSNLPLWKINSYRQRWGLEPLTDDVKPLDVSSDTKPSIINKITVNNRGPGTELIKMYEKMGVPSCSQCYELANKMNKWGADECIKRIEEIIEDILPRAKTWVSQNKPWVNTFLPNALTEKAITYKIRSDVEKAINLAKLPPKQQIVSKTTKKRTQSGGGCGCSKKNS